MSKPNAYIAAESPAIFFVLLALTKDAACGADIVMQVLADSAATILIPKSTIYDQLKALEERGLVSSTAPERSTAARIYRIAYESAVHMGKQRLR